ncbi:hypothetical protein BC940DRAFT_36064 [Gongronella butleri]|nr:hypothetical protein BC940DRAFT_36064 [Gongronella butleri]
MPLPYENELDHWRSSSHPLPSRPSDAPPTLKPSFSFRNEGWALDNAAASSSSQPKKHRRRRRPTDDTLAKGQEHELLDAVSNEEILQLTNLATTLPDRSRKKEYRHDHLVSHDQIKASIRRQQSTHDNDDGEHEDDQPLMVPEEGWRSGTADTEGSAPTKSYDPSTFSTDTDDTAFRQQRQQIQTMIDAYTHQHQPQQHQPPPTKDELAAPSMSKQPSMEQPAPEKPTVTIPGPERRRTWHMNLIKKKQALSASSSTTTASYDDDWQPSSSHATIWKRPHLKRLRFSRHHRSSSQDTSSNGNKRQQASSSTSAGSGAPILMAQATSSNISHKKHRLSAILRRRHSFDNLREFHSDDDSDLLRPVAASAANSIHDRPAGFASPPPMHQVTSTATSTSTPSTDTQQQHSHHSHLPHDTPPATHLRHHVPNPDQGPDQQRDTTTPSPDHHQPRVQVQTPPSLPTTPPPIHPTEQPTPNATPVGPKRVLYFDVDALPGAIDASNMAALVHRIVDAGHGAIRKMRVRFDDMDALNDAENDDDDDDDDDDVEDENGDRLPAIKASKLITPNIHALVDPSGGSVVRRVAEVVSSKPQGLLNLHLENQP